MAPSNNNAATSDVYIICSDDPMLKLERSSALINQARNQLPSAEFLLYTFSELQGNGGSPNLKDIEGQMSDPGLFGGDRIIKVILKDFDELAIELFKLIACSYRPGLFIIVEMPRIANTYGKVEAKSNADLKMFSSFLPGSDGEAALLAQESKTTKKGTKSKAKTIKKPKRATGLEARRKESFGYLKGIGAHIEFIYTPEGRYLQEWILTQARSFGLSVTPEALDFIISSCDNNLLVMYQSLQMMQLVRSGNNAPLTLEDVENYFTQDARYTGFEISEAILMANHNKALNIIYSFCSGQNQGLSQAIGFLISRLDESLNIVYKGKQAKIASAPINERTAFFMQNKIKVRSAQEAHLKAIRDMPEHMLVYLTKNLAQASRAYSHYDNDQALLALQRMACVKYPLSYGLTDISEDYC